MKKLILGLLRRVAGTTRLREEHVELEARVTALSSMVRDNSSASRTSAEIDEIRQAMRPLLEQARGRADFQIPHWWGQSFWEPTVALAIRDHVRPGAIAYDVGCNAGALAMQMSRLAGPLGRICAFEASPRIMPRTQYNLIHAGCFNTTLFHRAVWHTSGASVNIAPGTDLNDRIDAHAPGVPVLTLALDDFAAATGLVPSFIKMDIEGAEYDGLRGMPRLLRETRPVLVLEQSPTDMRCHELLLAAGYAAVDLATYHEIRTVADFQDAPGVANMLFLPRESAGDSPYLAGGAELQARLPAEQFARAPNGSMALADPLSVSPGRYIVRANFSAEGVDNEVLAGIEVDGEVKFRYHTNTRFMADSYRDWVIQMDRPGRITPFLKFLNGTDPTLVWRGAEVLRLPAFDACPAPLIM